MIFKDKKKRLVMPEFDLLSNGEVDLYKTAIKNAVGTYPLEWRVVFETLQNSIDAINKNENVAEGKIDIIFDIDERRVTIKDNGIGFPLKKKLFFLNGGTKADDKNSKGKIGVGLKVTIFSSDYFFMNSVIRENSHNSIWTAEVKDGYKYMDKNAISVVITNPQETKLLTGTTIIYSFPDDSIMKFIQTASMRLNDISDKVERSLNNKFVKAMEHFFRTNGYAADTVNLINDKFSKKITIEIVINYKSIPIGLDAKLNAIFRDFNGKINFLFNNKFWDVEEMVNAQHGLNKPSIISHKFYDRGSEFGKFNPDNFMWARKFTDKNEIKELLPKRTKDNFDKLLDKINGIYLALGTISNMRKFYFQTPTQFISINGVPSDHKLPTPTSNTAYSNLVLCIIDVDSSLNYGKLQTTDRHLIHNCGQFYLEMYKNAVVKIGEKVGTAMDIDTSATNVEMPTKITELENLGINCNFKKIPTDENALIGIFFDLLGREIIKDYEFYSLHAKQRYDSTAMIKTPKMRTVPLPNNDSDLKFVEFKLKLSQLIDDIEDGEKDLKKINLIVVWEDDASGNPNKPIDYEIIDLEDSHDKDAGFYGVKKCLVNRFDGTERQVFIMKDFIENLRSTPSQPSPAA